METTKATPSPFKDVPAVKPIEVVEAPKLVEPLTLADKVPSNWSAVALSVDEAIFTNSQTGRKFSGTPKEFSKFIKG